MSNSSQVTPVVDLEVDREIYKEAPGRRRECLYYLALGQYKLGHYNEARRYNDLLLEREPRNMQALSLKALIDDRVAKGDFS